MNPSKLDPTRTTMLRKRFERQFSAAFRILQRDIAEYFESQNPILFTANASYTFPSNATKVKAFAAWLQGKMQGLFLTSPSRNPSKFEQDYGWLVEAMTKGYTSGRGRAYLAVRGLDPDMAKKIPGSSQSRSDFLKSAFTQPETVEKIQLLFTRSYTDLDGITKSIAAEITRELSIGLALGENPKKIARRLVKRAGLGKVRAHRFARTEIIRAHAEGALTAMKDMGVTHVGVAVEWSTAGDGRVCQKCKDLQGVVLHIDDATGLFPRHPNCRCTPIPALMKSPGQIRTKSAVKRAVAKSLSREKRSTWAGQGLNPKKLPASIV